jgi:hypothetical protein
MRLAIAQPAHYKQRDGNSNVSSVTVILKMLWDVGRAIARFLGQLLLTAVRPLWILVRTLFQIKEGEIARPILLFGAVAILTWAGAVLVGAFQWRTPRANLGQFTALGEVAAEETASMVGNSGQIVILMLDGKPADSPYRQTIASFTTALPKAGNLMVMATRTIQSDNRPDGANLSAEEFLDLIGEYRAVDAIVSFSVVPKLAASDFKKLPPARPKILIASMPVSANTKALLVQHAVQRAIVARPAPPVPPPATATRRQRFDNYFMVVDGHSVSALP